MTTIELFCHSKHLMLRLACALILAMGSLGMTTVAYAHSKDGYDPNERVLLAQKLPEELKEAGIEEQLGGQIDQELRFTDEDGHSVQLKDFYSRGKPVLISLVYYSCPHLCNFHLNGLTDVFKQMKWTTGNQFEAIAVSIDPKEKPELAKAKKDAHMKVYGRPEGAKGWHFLTGSEDQIKQLAKQIGFKYYWDQGGGQWAHASAAVVTTPSGKISRYLHGILFDPQTTRLALFEASEGKISSVIDSLIMYCFQFDPNQHRYVFIAWNFMRVMAGLAAIGIGVWLTAFWLRQRKQLQNVRGVPS
jgi:protein SCO1/2